MDNVTKKLILIFIIFTGEVSMPPKSVEIENVETRVELISK